MPANRLESEIVITAKDETGKVLNGITAKFDRMVARLANIGLATNTVKNFVKSLTAIANEAQKANTAIVGMLDSSNISLQMFQSFEQGSESLKKFKEQFKGIAKINDGFAFALDQTDVENTRALAEKTTALSEAWHGLGTTISKIVTPVITFIKGLMADALNLADALLKKVLSLVGIGNDENTILGDFKLAGDGSDIKKLEIQRNAINTILKQANKDLEVYTEVQKRINHARNAGYEEAGRAIRKANEEIARQTARLTIVNDAITINTAIEIAAAKAIKDKADKLAKLNDETEEQISLADRLAKFESENPLGGNPFFDEDRMHSIPLDTPVPPIIAAADDYREKLEMLGNTVQATQGLFSGLEDAVRAFGNSSMESGTKTFKVFKALHLSMATIAVATAAAQAAADWKTLGPVGKIAAITSVVAAGANLIATIKGTTATSAANVQTGGGGGGSVNESQQLPNIGQLNGQNGNRLIVNLNGRRGYDAEDMEELIEALNDFDTGTQINVNRIGN